MSLGSPHQRRQLELNVKQVTFRSKHQLVQVLPPSHPQGKTTPAEKIIFRMNLFQSYLSDTHKKCLSNVRLLNQEWYSVALTLFLPFYTTNATTGVFCFLVLVTYYVVQKFPLNSFL